MNKNQIEEQTDRQSAQPVHVKKRPYVAPRTEIVKVKPGDNIADLSHDGGHRKAGDGMTTCQCTQVFVTEVFPPARSADSTAALSVNKSDAIGMQGHWVDDAKALVSPRYTVRCMHVHRSVYTHTSSGVHAYVVRCIMQNQCFREVKPMVSQCKTNSFEIPSVSY